MIAMAAAAPAAAWAGAAAMFVAGPAWVEPVVQASLSSLVATEAPAARAVWVASVASVAAAGAVGFVAATRSPPRQHRTARSRLHRQAKDVSNVAYPWRDRKSVV